MAPKPVFHLNPEFEIEGDIFLMVTHFIAALPVTILGPVVTSLDKEVSRSIDIMLSGY